MTAPTPKEVVNEWFEQVWISRDKSAIPRLRSEDAVAHLAGDAQVCGTAQFSGFQDSLLASFPDLSVRNLRSVGDDMQACLHWEASGTHRGDLVGIAATNREVNFSGISFVTVRDGKIAEGCDCWDYGTLTSTLSSPERLKIRVSQWR